MASNNSFYAEGSIFDTAIETVNQRMQTAIGYAQSAFSESFKAIQALENIGKGLTARGISITPISIPPYSHNMADITKPTTPTTEILLPPLPTKPNLFEIPEGTVTFPQFNIQMPQVDLPELPEISPIEPPQSPPQIAEPTIPEVPTFEMPSPPSLILPNIPEIPGPNFPEFDARPPDPSSLIPPDPMISDGGRDVTIIRGLKEKVENMLANERPAYSAEIEREIFLRESERALQIHQDTIDRICAEWAKRRAPLPDGALLAMIQEQELNYTNRRYDTSRDIAIKNYELTQQNIQNLISMGINLQNVYFTSDNMIAQRAFEASKATADAMIASYNAGVKKYELLVDTFKTVASVYEARVRAEVAKAEYYKTQIEGAKLTADINDAFVKLYLAQLNGVESVLNIYKAEMDGARIFSEIQKTRLDAYRTQIEAYIATINAKTAEYSLYKAKIDGETAKVDIYEKQVEAFKAEVQAKTMELNGYIEKMRGYSDLNKSLIQQYVADVDAYRSIVQAETMRIDGIVKTYLGEVEAYKSQIQAEGVIADIGLRAYEAEIKKILAEYEANLKASEIEIKNFEVLSQLRIEAMKGIAQVASSLTLGALSSLHVSASIGASGSAVGSRQYQEQLSTSYVYSYEMPTPAED